ncbi:DivIVA domain-containing protein [Actinoplanes sp. TFC3]|uniref:DivIVA domain-containing protein n=1 Tax=Actinoplanes sp. TFC3 TaxID=1710355 RepID=UPI0008361C85|nr:DivIVA domain-containing protein [Actinoplanes sp. TFC3]
MPLTPADVHNVAFKKPAIGKRGYDEEEVDAFLDEVERELIRLLEENNELRAHLGPGAAPGSGGEDAAQRMQAELAELRSRLERTMREQSAAEQAANQVHGELEQARSGTRSYPAPPSSEGPGASPRVLQMAQRTADEHVNDARREADTLLVEARAKAEQTVQEAMDRAATLELEARQRHSEAVQSLGQKRNDMLREISGLAGLADDYRNRLHEALATHLLDLETVPPAQHDGGGAAGLPSAANL